MAEFEKCLPHLKKWEGGWSNHPNDLGRETNCGLTISFFIHYAFFAGIYIPTIDDMETIHKCYGDKAKRKQREIALHELKNLKWDSAAKIHKATFWDRIDGDNIHDQKVASTLFDHHVNADQLTFSRSIYSKAISMVQEIVEVKNDGIMGPVTLKSINEYDSDILFDKYQAERINYYNHLVKIKPKNKVFLNGWLLRVNDLYASQAT